MFFSGPHLWLIVYLVILHNYYFNMLLSQKNVFFVSCNYSRRCFCTNEDLVCGDYPSSPNPPCVESSNEGWYICINGVTGDDGDCILPTDCYDIFTHFSNLSGIYFIKPTSWPGSPFEVYCNMSNGGGWTVSYTNNLKISYMSYSLTLLHQMLRI